MTERFIPMEGGRNLRDMGGYAAADGRTVRWRTLYRSGSLGRIAGTGPAVLAGLGLGAIVDLRSNSERAKDSHAAFTAAARSYWARDYDYSGADLQRRFADPASATAEGGRAMMIDAFRALPGEQAASYAMLFARLLDCDGPLLFKCSAGKDRTGLAAALVLTALDVPHETVLEDFLLSRVAPGMESLAAAMEGIIPAAQLAHMISVEPAYLDSAWAAIRAEHGSVERYLAALGVGPAETDRLRDRLLA